MCGEPDRGSTEKNIGFVAYTKTYFILTSKGYHSIGVCV